MIDAANVIVDAIGLLGLVISLNTIAIIIALRVRGK